jgi:surfactin synthase thioesterase subunit/aryl carrier-like protein
LVERQEALAGRYWKDAFSREKNSKKGIEHLLQQDYKYFLQTGIIADADYLVDLLSCSGAQYFPSVTEVDPWRTLTNTLANLYCLGLDIDWSGFEQGYSRRKVVLPTYPFQRTSFWCQPTMGRLTSPTKAESRSEERHPGPSLDGRITLSPLKTKQVEYRLSLDAMPDLRDTYEVLHVGYYLEMLSWAVKRLYHGATFRVQTIEFLSLLKLPESGAVTLSLTLNAKESGEVDFSLFCHQGGDNWNKHTQGTILLDAPNLSSGVDAGLRADIISRCVNQYSRTEFYHHLEERGFFLGERVQWLEQVWSCEGEALAQLRLPPGLKISHEYEMGVHPGVFDACAQLFHAALSRSMESDRSYMVSRWEDFVCNNQSVDQVLWCHVVLQDGPHIKGQLKGRFQLFDQNGMVVAQMRSGVMKRVTEESKDVFRKYLDPSKAAKERKTLSKIIRDLGELSQDQWIDYLNDYLQRVFAQILSVEVNDLLLDEALLDMGMDSIVGMEAKHQLEEELGIFLPIELLIVGPSIRELTESILPLLALKPYQMEHETRDNPVPASQMDIHSWIIHRKSNPQARVRLFCFPYGGLKGASLYREWQTMLPDSVEVCPVQLPGKENRVKEKAFTDIERATKVLKEVLAPLLDRPYAIYGHSGGALLAYRLAYKLWSEMDNKPGHLFVGAYSSPTILPNPVISSAREMLQEGGYDRIPDPESLSPKKREEILAMIHATLGEDQDLQSAWDEVGELRQLVLPTGLAELQMIENYNGGDKILFNIPITAFHGKMDRKVKESEMYAWQELTTGPFKCHTLPGAHLFLHKNQDQKQLLELISHDLEKYT